MISKHTTTVTVQLEVDIRYGWQSDDPSVGFTGGPEDLEVEAIRGLIFQTLVMDTTDNPKLKKYFGDIPKHLQSNFRAYFDDDVMKQIEDTLKDYAANNPPEPDLDD